MKIFLPFLILSFYLVNIGFSQEKADTSQFNPNFKPQFDNHFSFDATFNERYPLSGDYNTLVLKTSQLFDYKNTELSSYSFFTSPENSFYQFSSNGFSFWQNMNPLILGVNYHYKNAFGIKNLDLFVDAQGELFDGYDLKSEGLIPNDKKIFIWNASVGAAYEIKKGSTLFIKRSVSFENLSPTGHRNFGGMNVKF